MNEQLKKMIAKLSERNPIQSLSPKRVWDRELEMVIEAINLPGKGSDSRVIALLSALHLLNDHIDKAHVYAQEIEHEATGAYWHGIVHRMEGDYSNAKYWFYRAGDHPVMRNIRERTAEWLQGNAELDQIVPERIQTVIINYRDEADWNSATFVDMVAVIEGVNGSKYDETRHILEQIQRIEIMELFDYTLDKALNH